MKPHKQGSKNILQCSCGYKEKDTKDATIKQEVEKEDIANPEVADESQDMKTLPEMEAECPECGHKKARFWTVQTRAADEPETKFLKCEKCKHTWRDYN